MKLTTMTQVTVDGVMQETAVGQGTRLFPDAGPDIALDLVESRAAEGRDDPGLPAHRAPAVCNRHRRLKHET